ncbi:MAG: TIR domain-containing protein [Candidatus Delongbacteria bacterium]|nr:TIR domain-containing protein [Candidatus Delongbacteria bacterium]
MRKTDILIVEDNVFPEGKRLEKLLGNEGHNILGIAVSKQQAVELALKYHPEIIIMDIQLQKGENIDEKDDKAGISAALEIQKNIDCHIIYLTALDVSETFLSEITKTNSFDLLIKPATKEQIVTTINLASLYKIPSNTIFICYSHHDFNMVKEMLVYLDPLSDLGISTWADFDMNLGANWSAEIRKRLYQVQAAILLISINFVNSSFIKKYELPILLELARSKKIEIIPVFIRYVSEHILERKGLLKFQGINSPNDPVFNWNPRKREEMAWAKLYEYLESKLR